MNIHRVILGAGSAGRTALGILRRNGDCGGVVFLDDRLAGSEVNGVKVAGEISRRGGFPEAEFLITYGTMDLARKLALFDEMDAEGARFFNVIAPGVYIDDTAGIGRGNVVCANSVIHPNASIGNCCFICAASIIDHDCMVMDGAHISPGVSLAGGVTIGRGAMVGTNATLLPNVKVGDGAVIGAGAVVTRNVNDGETVAGVPARVIKAK